MHQFGIIYKITNLINSKTYIGSTTKTLNERFKEHVLEAKHRCKSPFHKAIRLYGEDKFHKEVLCSVLYNIENLRYQEDWFMDYFKSSITENGYNLMYSTRDFDDRPHKSICMKEDWRTNPNRQQNLKKLLAKVREPGFQEYRVKKYKETLINNPHYGDKRNKLLSEQHKNGSRNCAYQKTKDDWADPEKKKQRIKAMREGNSYRFHSIVSVSVISGEVKFYENVHDAMRDGVSQSCIYSSLNKPGTKGQNRLWFDKTTEDKEFYIQETLKYIKEFKTYLIKPIKVTDELGVTIDFKDAYEAANFLKIDIKKIRGCLKGKWKTHKGFKFEYSEEK